jgi:hypothetical protein
MALLKEEETICRESGLKRGLVISLEQQKSLSKEKSMAPANHQ